MNIQMPVKTEVVEKNQDICIDGKFTDGKIIIEMDTRERAYEEILELPRGTQIRWMNARMFEVHEIPCYEWPIIYRITTADGYYQEDMKRVHFTPKIEGLSTQKKVTDAVARLAAFLSVIIGLGCTKASWLMEVVF
jgi:hypothetical protein